jgi:exo-beta-1,3-glucanase (GH17 family)
VDVVIVTQYPYWQGSDITYANSTFYWTWATTEAAVKTVSPGMPLWIGETGWPTGSICLGMLIAQVDQTRVRPFRQLPTSNHTGQIQVVGYGTRI